MNKLFVALIAVLLVFGGVGSSSAGLEYDMDGESYFFVPGIPMQMPSQQGWTLGEDCEPYLTLTFVEGYTPVAGATFTEANITDITVWDKDGTVFLPYAVTESVEGTFSATAVANGQPTIDWLDWKKTPQSGGDSEMNGTAYPNAMVSYETPLPGGHFVSMQNVTFTANAVPIPGSILLLGTGVFSILGMRRRS